MLPCLPDLSFENFMHRFFIFHSVQSTKKITVVCLMLRGLMFVSWWESWGGLTYICGFLQQRRIRNKLKSVKKKYDMVSHRFISKQTHSYPLSIHHLCTVTWMTRKLNRPSHAEKTEIENAFKHFQIDFSMPDSMFWSGKASWKKFNYRDSIRPQSQIKSHAGKIVSWQRLSVF